MSLLAPNAPSRGVHQEPTCLGERSPWHAAPRLLPPVRGHQKGGQQGRRRAVVRSPQERGRRALDLHAHQEHDAGCVARLPLQDAFRVRSLPHQRGHQQGGKEGGGAQLLGREESAPHPHAGGRDGDEVRGSEG